MAPTTAMSKRSSRSKATILVQSACWATFCAVAMAMLDDDMAGPVAQPVEAAYNHPVWNEERARMERQERHAREEEKTQRCMIAWLPIVIIISIVACCMGGCCGENACTKCGRQDKGQTNVHVTAPVVAGQPAGYGSVQPQQPMAYPQPQQPQMVVQMPMPGMPQPMSPHHVAHAAAHQAAMKQPVLFTV